MNRFLKARTEVNPHGNLTMAVVAKHTGVSTSLIAALENDDNHRSVGYDKIVALAKYYEVSVDWLLGLSDVIYGASDFLLQTPLRQRLVASKPKAIIMEDIVQMVSEEYRKKRGEVSKLHDELREVNLELLEVKHTLGENISLYDYNKLIGRQTNLEEEIKIKTQFYEGMSYAREMLMDLGFDVKVEYKEN